MYLFTPGKPQIIHGLFFSVKDLYEFMKIERSEDILDIFIDVYHHQIAMTGAYKFGRVDDNTDPLTVDKLEIAHINNHLHSTTLYEGSNNEPEIQGPVHIKNICGCRFENNKSIVEIFPLPGTFIDYIKNHVLYYRCFYNNNITVEHNVHSDGFFQTRRFLIISLPRHVSRWIVKNRYRATKEPNFIVDC